jgi:Uma2 family endonuclease
MAATTLLTSDQFLAMPEEIDQYGNRIKDELIGGEVVKMPPASQVHDRIKNRINRLLIRYLDANPAVPLDSLVEIGAQVGELDTFIPEVSIVKREPELPEGRIMRGSPCRDRSRFSERYSQASQTQGRRLPRSRLEIGLDRIP